MKGLTDRQSLVLDFIRSGIRDRGFPPTLREICRALGFRSTNGAADHVNALIRKGFIVRTGGWKAARAIEVVGGEPKPNTSPPIRRLNSGGHFHGLILTRDGLRVGPGVRIGADGWPS